MFVEMKNIRGGVGEFVIDVFVFFFCLLGKGICVFILELFFVVSFVY